MSSSTSKTASMIEGVRGRLDDDLWRVYLALTSTGVLGMSGVLLYALSESVDRGVLPTVGGAALIGGASAFLGSLVGFLFAIPRSRQGQDGAASANTERRLSDYAANTNLEQISDWLTKILVGIGLLQFREIGDQVAVTATTFAPLIGTGPTARPAALALMIYFGVWGFFFAYLATRLWLPKALSRAEREEEVRKQEVEKAAEQGGVATAAYNALYETAPGGFTQAIEIIESYLSKPGALKTATLYMYLAAAYGQQHAYLKSRNLQDQAAQAASSAIAAVEEALKRGPETKGVLVQLYRGTNPDENDLASLRDEPRLEELLGQ